MNLLERAVANEFSKSGESKKISISGKINNIYDVYSIPIELLYYNDQNGRINTTYMKYKSENGSLEPEKGDSEYNKIFERFIYDSNSQALIDTISSIKAKTQQEPAVVLPDGRVIDGNRRFTALRMIQNEINIPQTLNAIIIPLDANSKVDEKKIKELELDLQLGKEERVNYDPIDRIFDVYKTIVIDEMMTKEEYKKASGAKTTRGIKKDLRLAELIIKFIEIVSPGGDPIDKFYIARELKLDGPIQEIEGVLTKLVSSDKESITQAVLTHLAVSKTDPNQQDSTRVMRDVKNHILKNEDNLKYYLDAVDDKLDIIIDSFQECPIKSANDIKVLVSRDDDLSGSVEKLINSTNRIIYKGMKDNVRREGLLELEGIRESLEEIQISDFDELTDDEFIDAKSVLSEINDILFRLKQDLKI
ncbi:ParB/RepB/Spo0J family partition protein [Erysipelothrix rhusiopathiae]|nr:ParB/RepB/Spo0J family partition protein [Erysipelothrix rhusiopathiae]MDE8039575.1 ParB/RepB/Spo0J family partition protein [Erysipelothrix rhusiopathiae]MDE8042307.1 ParB/RepB/Spo0J family partition protein [Erysipelothrix rhusiopathiae]MDE8049760.1 ParB/RepB/Spo0J family partition protein [Erysipelothrix rhusiopathiae]MDE8051370.1 ParB/RepB/Spo0J family partition protein [Erysipelothrix rhusiopathiae]